MNYRPLGRTGWRVSHIRFGARPSAVLNNCRTSAEATGGSKKSHPLVTKTVDLV